MSTSRTTRSATSAVMSAEPTACGSTSTTSAPTSSTRPVARVGVGIEVDQADGTAPLGDRGHARFGNRVVAAQNDRQRPGIDDLTDEAPDRVVRPDGIGANDRRVAVVDDTELREGVDAGFEVRTGRARGRADRPRRKPRSRPVRHEVVGRSADDRNVDAVQMPGLLRDWSAAEREKAGVVRLVRQGTPAPLRVDHEQSPPTKVFVTSRSADETAFASSGSCPSTQPVSTSSSAP